MYICGTCSHVFNAAYDERVIDYNSSSCTMYNSGKLWQTTVKNWWSDYTIFAKHHTVIEIGAGDGEFLQWLPGHSVKIAFEPGIDSEKCIEKGLNTVCRYFDPDQDIRTFKPTHIILRHVLEHITDPKAFVNSILKNCVAENLNTVMMVEVPLVENALTDGRIEDWVYEHPHHFTKTSLTKLFSGWNIIDIQTMYNNEVVIIKAETNHLARSKFFNYAVNNFQNLRTTRLDRELWELKYAGNKVAFWGGAGKSAMFLHTINPDGSLGIVVDSDDRKVGKYVPGTAIQIKSIQELIDNPVDIIVITTSWRADDIAKEIVDRKINCEKLCYFMKGQLKIYG